LVREDESKQSLERSLSTILMRIEGLEGKTDRALQSSVAMAGAAAVLPSDSEDDAAVSEVAGELEDEVLEASEVVESDVDKERRESAQERRRRELALAGAGGLIAGATVVGLLSSFMA
jgi:hypothetical protein